MTKSVLPYPQKKASEKLELVVLTEKGRAITTSRIVAEAFSKRHKDVLKKIKNLRCSKSFSGLNFAPANYIDKQGKPRIEYAMSREGWMFLVLSFTGAKADRAKEAFINAFSYLESVAKRQTKQYWIEARSGKIKSRRLFTDTIEALQKHALALGSEGAHHFYSQYTKMIYKELFNVMQSFDNLPNMMTRQQLLHVALAEEKVCECISRGLQDGVDYHDIYFEAKVEVNDLAAALGKTDIPSFELPPPLVQGVLDCKPVNS